MYILNFYFIYVHNGIYKMITELSIQFSPNDGYIMLNCVLARTNNTNIEIMQNSVFDIRWIFFLAQRIPNALLTKECSAAPAVLDGNDGGGERLLKLEIDW